jgi:BASS family bile acid:Na+ symporter
MALENILVNLLVPLSMFVVMTIIGLDLSTDDFKRIIRHPKAILIGTVCQLVTLPILAAIIISSVVMSDASIGALIIFSACPGGGLSNIMTAQARGNIALSVSYTAFASLLALFTIPLIASFGFDWFLSASAIISVPIIPMIVQLALLLLAPILVGMWIRNRYPEFIQRYQKIIDRLGNLFIILIIAMSFSVDNSATGADVFSAFPAALSFSLGSILIGIIVINVSGLSYKDRIALLIEFSVRHAGIATLIILVILQRFDMMALLTAITIVQVIAVILVVIATRLLSPQRSIEK